MLLYTHKLVFSHVQREAFSEVLSLQTWRDVLTEEEREKLKKLLPEHPSLEKEEVLR